ncbi:MAG: hypothetical protein K0B07_05890 [DPANN group archaeon]|nr:hypothetical protein [DPANN group archaeon]
MKIIKRILNLIPQENKLLYRLCKKYSDQFNGENDGTYTLMENYLF